jgi:hypothetical protein
MIRLHGERDAAFADWMHDRGDAGAKKNESRRYFLD